MKNYRKHIEGKKHIKHKNNPRNNAGNIHKDIYIYTYIYMYMNIHLYLYQIHVYIIIYTHIINWVE